MSYMSLCHLPAGKTASVLSLLTRGNMRRRLLDIGLTPGSKVTCLYESPAGDPRAYLICDAVIALRAKDANRVIITFP